MDEKKLKIMGWMFALNGYDSTFISSADQTKDKKWKTTVCFILVILYISCIHILSTNGWKNFI